MRTLLLSIACFLCLSLVAQAEQRFALVIGNANYSAVTPLENARTDAELIAAALKNLGFEVTLVTDGPQQEMKRAVAEFGAALRSTGPDAVGLFYYAGHGVQSFGANYLLPVDADLTVAADLDLVGLEASTVLRQMASARNRTNIVILDACRDNPFENLPDMNDSGLAEMKAPTGTFLSYATAPGEVALDGLDGNSPFTKALAREIRVEGLPIEQVFKRVRVAVLAETAGLQTPWDTSSLTEDFVFMAGDVLTPKEEAEEQLWKSVKASEDAGQIMLFMRTFPTGRFVADARTLLAIALEAELNAGTVEPTEPVASMPARREVADEETALMERARATDKLEDYEAYLESFPEGVFAELVKIEIAVLAQNSTVATVPNLEGDNPETQRPFPEALEWEVYFDEPLEKGAPEIQGLTIPEVISLFPLFPPIEGLPEAMWKEQACSNCHEWTREALCDQGKFYQREATVRSLQQQHPFGGGFKQNLETWANGGCR